ncbi:MAG TPA: hypothetical protein PLW14_03105 [Chlorobiota bacterium]|nr:hypothetical protein [Chlorobiota bacterium]
MKAPSLLRRVYLALVHGTSVDTTHTIVELDPNDRVRLAAVCQNLEEGHVLTDLEIQKLAEQRAYHFMSNVQFVRLVEATIIDKLMNGVESSETPNTTSDSTTTSASQS